MHTSQGDTAAANAAGGILMVDQGGRFFLFGCIKFDMVFQDIEVLQKILQSMNNSWRAKLFQMDIQAAHLPDHIKHTGCDKNETEETRIRTLLHSGEKNS